MFVVVIVGKKNSLIIGARHVKMRDHIIQPILCLLSLLGLSTLGRRKGQRIIIYFRCSSPDWRVTSVNHKTQPLLRPLAKLKWTLNIFVSDYNKIVILLDTRGCCKPFTTDGRLFLQGNGVWNIVVWWNIKFASNIPHDRYVIWRINLPS